MPQQHLELLRTAIPYIRTYKGRVFVIKLGGQLCRPGKTLANLVDQVSLLYQLGIRPVIVHGGGEQADAMTRRLGHEPRQVGGRRVTDDAALDTVKMVFAGTVNTDLVAAFRAAHVPAIGMSGIDGDLVTARRRPPQIVLENGQERQVDFGHVGDIDSVNVNVLRTAFDGGYVPIVCSLASDENGQILNVNGDTIAARIAIEIQASKYFLVTTVDGVMGDLNDPRTLHSYLDLDELAALIDKGVVSGGMLPKLAACRDALLGGVPRVHIVNGLTNDTLLSEVFTNEGCGTLIIPQRKAALTTPT